jgi:ribose/xylose/arabinose/galactoside ABC-type transport system permease subunit
MALLVCANWIRSAFPLVPLALAAALIISCGKIDIASGAAFSFVGMIIVAWTKHFGTGTSLLVAALFALCSVILFYLLMYMLTIFGRIPALLCSLGMAIAAQGISLVLQASITGRHSESGLTGMIVPLDDLRLFNWPVFTILVVVILLAIFRYNTDAGLDHIAVGIDELASQVAGVKIRTVYLRAYIFSGLLVGLSALLFLVNVQLGGWATNMGWGKELLAIAAAVIGGSRITGGRFDPLCVALATLLVFGISDITNAMNVPLEWDYLILGIGVVVAGLIDGVYAKRT